MLRTLTAQGFSRIIPVSFYCPPMSTERAKARRAFELLPSNHYRGGDGEGEKGVSVSHHWPSQEEQVVISSISQGCLPTSGRACHIVTAELDFLTKRGGCTPQYPFHDVKVGIPNVLRVVRINQRSTAREDCLTAFNAACREKPPGAEQRISHRNPSPWNTWDAVPTATASHNSGPKVTL